MKGLRRGKEALSETDNDFGIKKKEKIELVNCPRGGITCVEHRSVINGSYNESDVYLRNKEYRRSIECLNNAFTKTTELQETTCKNCAEYFRLTIVQSLEEIHDDLQKMSKGFFRAKHYRPSYEMAKLVLEQMKSEMKR